MVAIREKHSEARREMHRNGGRDPRGSGWSIERVPSTRPPSALVHLVCDWSGQRALLGQVMREALGQPCQKILVPCGSWTLQSPSMCSDPHFWDPFLSVPTLVWDLGFSWGWGSARARVGSSASASAAP